MENLENQNIVPVELVKEMQKSYIDYAMSVIVARALPDVRDGLKPVHRRILYTMHEDGFYPDKPHRKCATTVGDVLGRYHPHGDASVYDALVRLAQDFSLRYPLVDGHGNFGSVDGDPAAAYRYTESRMSKMSVLMLRDIEKETVDYIKNYDESRQEPVVLPSRFPNLLVNGSSGIAVGMATNIPPHNLNEVIDGIIAVIENPEITIEEIMEYIKGPDFPTAGIIMGKGGIRSTYLNGKGKIIVRARAEIEDVPHKDRQRIVVTELPYMVNKSRLVSKIAELVNDKKIDGIADLNDESGRDGMRIVIDIKRDANAGVVLNNLYKLTQMQETFGAIMLALVDNQPKILNLREILDNYISFQEQIITRRTEFDLKKAEARAHIVEGLLKALDHIDEIIKIIRNSYNNAKENLINTFDFSDIQAQAILDMKLARLQGLEKEKLENEFKDLLAKIEYYKEILSSEEMVLDIIKKELTEIKDKFGDERRTEISLDYEEIEDEDLIEVEDIVVTATHCGYVKRMRSDTYKAQKRGGRGITGMQTKEEDFVEQLFTTSTHHYILFFTNKGRMHKIKAYKIPEAGRNAKGIPIVNLINLDPDEYVTASIPIREFNDENYLLMITKMGTIKKTNLSEYDSNRSGGLNAISLADDDELIRVKLTNGENDIIIGTHDGNAIRFNEKDVRPMGRTAHGVRGIKLRSGDYVVGASLVIDGHELLVVSENGMGKRTDISEYKVQTRGGVGVRTYKVSEKTGKVCGIKTVTDDDDIMLITSEGVIIRTGAEEISTLRRDTSGVKLMRVKGDIKVVSIAKIKKEEEDEEEATNEEVTSEENSIDTDDENKVTE